MLKINEEYLYSFVDMSASGAGYRKRYLAKSKKNKSGIAKNEGMQNHSIAGWRGLSIPTTRKVTAVGGLKWGLCASNKNKCGVTLIWQPL